MQGVDVFCERCGTPQPKPEASAGRSPGILARRVLDAVGITETETTGAEDWLRLCLSCRGYSCPTCWNDSAGACQTCEPLPEPIVEFAHQPTPPPVAAVLPPFVAPELPEPFLYPPAPEPVVVAEPEPVVVAEPEPVVVAEPELLGDPIERPASPRMPVLPLPPPRPADAPPMPLPPLQPYPVTPQIGFNPGANVGPSAHTSAPAFEAHLLLAPPPELPPNAIAAGLRPCSSCRVTLSARAHFCRRCGTAQAH